MIQRLLACVLISFTVLVGGPVRAVELPPDFDALVEEALETGLLTPSDIVIKTDYVETDPFRLTIATELLAEPLAIPRWTEGVAERVARATRLGRLIDLAAELKDLDVTATSFSPKPPEDRGLVEALEALAGAQDAEVPESTVDDALREVPPPIQEALAILVEASIIVQQKTAGAYAGLTAGEQAFVLANVHRIATAGEEAEPDEVSELTALIAKVDQQRLAEAAKVLCVAVDRVRDLLAEHADELENAAGLDEPARITTPLGDIVVGSGGDDVHGEGAFILIDPAGNDTYLGRVGASSAAVGGIGIAIDLAGDDQYIAREPFAFGAATCGFGILVDEAGDDGYTGTHNCLGRGLLGLGLLVDAEGIDRYYADTASQAAAHFGFGLLVDEAGNDHYTAHLNSQAHAGMNGVAILIDTGGNDTYAAGGKHKDYREGQKYYGSLSQGFSIGWRPLYSGGFGGLFDYAGNDIYIGDYFAQGSSYWFAVGLLYDDAGDDRYIARRYSQGAATHSCVGILADSRGDDTYTSWGVTQGSAHDLSAAMLIDGAGNDRYTAHWLAQGAGNANGIGFLIDLEGDDEYSGKRNTVQGAGTYGRKQTTYSRARGYPSIGVLIDGAGADTYSHGGGDGLFWHNAAFGAGFDAGSEAEANRHENGH